MRGCDMLHGINNKHTCMQHIRQRIAILSLMLFPLMAAAQTFQDTLTRIIGFLNKIIPFLVLIGTVIFLWGVVRYITAGGDEDQVKEARNLMFWGVVFLAVMIGVWGLVNIVLTFIFDVGDPIRIIPKGNNVPQQR